MRYCVCQFLLVLLTLQPFSASAASFDPATVTCKTHTESFERYQQLFAEDMPIYNIEKRKARQRDLIAQARSEALQGDLVAMHLYGGGKIDYLFHELTEGGKLLGGTLPDTMKDDVVDALTFSHLASLQESMVQVTSYKNVMKLADDVNPYLGFPVPKEWLKEAEHNAERWKKHCKL